MGVLETAKRARRFIRDVTTRARYSGETLQLLGPLIREEDVSGEWVSQFEYQLLNGKRESFVGAASHLLAPRQRARLFFVLAESLGEDDFRPKNPFGNRNIIQDIWMQGKDRDIVLREIMSVNADPDVRQKVLLTIKKT